MKTKNLTSCGHTVNLVQGEKEQGAKQRAQSWLNAWGMAE